ncbi:MAG: hypothetical protein ACC682_02035 [Gemmatimonadota bacterium]
MTLIGFHRTLITVAILFCGGFSAWEYSAYTRDGGSGSLALAIAFAVITVGLIYYLINLQRFLDGRTS